MTTSTRSVYANVVEDVINKVRDEFNSDGPGEDVLMELQEEWKTKLKQADVVNGSIHTFLRADLKPGGLITPQSTSPLMSQRPPPDLNIAYVEGRYRGDTGTSQQSREKATAELVSSLSKGIQRSYWVSD